MKKRMSIIGTLLLCLSMSGQTTQFIANYDSAFVSSQARKVPLVIYFSGSDWCKPCIKLKEEILKSEQFAEFSKDMVIYIADFPFRTKQSKELKKINEGLAEKYNPKGIFPNLVVVNNQGTTIYQTGYKDIPPSDFIASMKKGME